MELTDIEAWAEQIPTGVHPSLAHRVARAIELPAHLFQGVPTEVPASLRGPSYPED